MEGKLPRGMPPGLGILEGEVSFTIRGVFRAGKIRRSVVSMGLLR
jgi:hypothetical protein